MITIKLTNKVAYTLILILAVLSASLVVYATNPATKSNPGHFSQEVTVNIAGTDKTLQAAIDDGSLGGGYYVPSDIKATSATHNGQFATSGIGYDEMQTWIQNNGCSGYHVCTVQEAVAYMARTTTGVPEAWITGGGNRELHSAGHYYLDCQAWTSNAGTGDTNPKGVYWVTTSRIFDTSVCNVARAVLCCK